VSATLPTPTRPGDLILVRAIAWWDSGQIQRAVGGIILASLPALYDLANGTTPFTWRGLVSALVAGLFAWMGLARAKSPDVVTGTTRLDPVAFPVRVAPGVTVQVDGRTSVALSKAVDTLRAQPPGPKV
jgi:hypothetical protein